MNKGKLCIDSSPHGATIYVDGTIVIDPITEEPKRTPFCEEVMEGRRNFRLVLEGHQIVDGYADIYAGQTTNISRNLIPGKNTEKEKWGQPEPQIWLNHRRKSVAEMFGMK